MCRIASIGILYSSSVITPFFHVLKYSSSTLVMFPMSSPSKVRPSAPTKFMVCSNVSKHDYNVFQLGTQKTIIPLGMFLATLHQGIVAYEADEVRVFHR